MSDIDYTILVPQAWGFDLVGFGTYPESSVLAGQTRRQVLEEFSTEEEARTYCQERGIPPPTSDSDHHPTNLVPSHPPSDFDPLDAGETWDDDY